MLARLTVHSHLDVDGPLAAALIVRELIPPVPGGLFSGRRSTAA